MIYLLLLGLSHIRMCFLHIIPNDFATKDFGSKFAKFDEKPTPTFRKIDSQTGRCVSPAISSPPPVAILTDSDKVVCQNEGGGATFCEGVWGKFPSVP